MSIVIMIVIALVKFIFIRKMIHNYLIKKCVSEHTNGIPCAASDQERPMCGREASKNENICSIVFK